MTSMGADIQEQVLQYVNLVKNNVLKHDPTTIGVYFSLDETLYCLPYLSGFVSVFVLLYYL
jgi:hypothetical protein